MLTEVEPALPLLQQPAWCFNPSCNWRQAMLLQSTEHPAAVIVTVWASPEQQHVQQALVQMPWYNDLNCCGF
jgi:hypothetical protein